MMVYAYLVGMKNITKENSFVGDPHEKFLPGESPNRQNAVVKFPVRVCMTVKVKRETQLKGVV
jgi:hypothetical protein